MDNWKNELTWVTAVFSELLPHASVKSLSGCFDNSYYILVSPLQSAGATVS